MTEHSDGGPAEHEGRGAAEEHTGVADTPEEHQGPASPSSTPGEPSMADGTAEVGVEIGRVEGEGTTFEPEEDPEAASEG